MGLFSRLFRLPLKPSLPPPPGFDALWHPGEIAECVSDGRWFTFPGDEQTAGPRLGDRLRVVAVGSGFHPMIAGPASFLEFPRWSHRFPAHCFRKVVPQADAAEAGDSQFLEQLRTRPAPAKQPEPAETASTNERTTS